MHACRTDALYTSPLSRLDREDADAFGAESVALGDMVRHMDDAGLWAPRGFAVSAEAYDRFLDATGLRRRLAEMIGALRPDGSNIAAISASIRAAILSAEITPDLRQEIVAQYQVLHDDVADWPLPVAVLASVTPEYMSEIAFGGRPPTAAFAQDAAALLDAVRKCYAALFTERALSYRLARGESYEAVRLGVSVQTVAWANAGGWARDIEDDEAAVPTPSAGAAADRRSAG